MAGNVTTKLIITAVDQTKQGFDSVGKKIDALTPSMAKVTAAVGAATAAVGVFAAKGAAAAEDLSRLSTAFGLTAEQAQRLKFAADLGDSSIETLGKAALKLTPIIGDVLAGKVSGTTDAIKKLNISTADLKNAGGDVTKQLALVGDRLRDVAPGMERARLATELFGARLALELTPALIELSENTQLAKSDLEAFGLVNSQIDIEQAKQLGDQFDRVKNIMGALSIRMAKVLAPVVAAVIDEFKDMAAKSKTAGDDGLDAGLKVAVGLAVVVDLAGQVVTGWQLITLGFLKAARKIGSVDLFPDAPEWVKAVFPVVGLLDQLDEGTKASAAETRVLNEAIADLEKSLLNKPAPGDGFAGKIIERSAVKLDEFRKAAAKAEKELASGATAELPGADDTAAKKKAEQEIARIQEQFAEIDKQTSDARRRADLERDDAIKVATEAGTKAGKSAAEINRVVEQAKVEHIKKITEIDAKEIDNRRKLEDELLAFRIQSADEKTRIELELAKFEVEVQRALTDGKIKTQAEADALIIEATLRKTEAITAIEIAAAEKDAAAKKKIRDQEIEDIVKGTGLTKDTAEQLRSFNEQSFAQQLGTAAAFGSEFLGKIGSTNKKIFELQKKAAIANAIVSTASAATKALDFPPGPPVSFAYVAAAIASGAAQIATIRSQQFGGGGSVGSGGGRRGGGVGAGAIGGGGSGSAALGVSAEAEAPPPSTVSITLYGKNFDREDVSLLIEQINEHAADNANLQFRTV